MSIFAGQPYYQHLRMIRIDVSSLTVLVVAKFEDFVGLKSLPSLKRFETNAKQVVQIEGRYEGFAIQNLQPEVPHHQDLVIAEEVCQVVMVLFVIDDFGMDQWQLLCCFAQSKTVLQGIEIESVNVQHIVNFPQKLVEAVGYACQVKSLNVEVDFTGSLRQVITQ